MDMMREMAYTMWEQAAVAHPMMDQLRKRPETGHGRNSNGPEVDLKYLKFAEFRKANLPNFRGAFGPDKGEEWINAKRFSLY